MEKLDPSLTSRRKMAQRLDPSTGADWRELARRLGLGTLENAFRYTLQSHHHRLLIGSVKTYDRSFMTCAEEMC
ncbi:hypothetical protein OS493_040440 [Desmophyllum pertusum]|uniref:Death domain-containing protein n=1 Tax=Desmophyllum pertusum TaxID=174260 RepID=A0A9W9ZHQ8_9CNID|nr:hypothetical protein OS493_040440 [Desmophyllum pertusum]